MELHPVIAFPSVVYTSERPEFIEASKSACDKALAKACCATPDEVYPVVMSGTLLDDPEMLPFIQTVANAAWSALSDQGYDLTGLETFFTELWCQEHHRGSNMEQHVHGFGDQIVGFYFMDVPEKSSRVIFHDPKPGKVQIGLRESEPSVVTPASTMINFEPKPGMLIFSSAWLPHSTTRHGGDTPLRFIHFNIAVRAAAPNPNVEVV
jgi:hypothetical protein